MGEAMLGGDTMTVPRAEHPRPDFVREPWITLNGEWEFAFDDRDTGERGNWHSKPLPSKIIVPFPFQSPSSGIGDPSPHPICWYRRSFTLPLSFRGLRVRLVFGAVDYRAKLWVNGTPVGEHEGGYTPFAFDITEHLKRADNWIALRVEDWESPTQARGKQSREERSHGIFYTRCTGIWQSVWLEGVGEARIDHLQVLADPETGFVRINAWVLAQPVTQEIVATVVLPGGGTVSFRKEITPPAAVGVPAPVSLEKVISPVRLWSPESPVLYDLKLEIRRGHVTSDRVATYLAFRSIEARAGKIWLNGKPIFLRFALDQGYFPRGLYAAETDHQMRRDIELAKLLGFNGARKHQKVEDPRYLYWADKLGFLVWDEMASFFEWSQPASQQFAAEWLDVVRRDRNHPCVIAWVPFNESWGVPRIADHSEQQAFVERIYSLTKSEDPTRPVVDNSGWEHVKTDIADVHDYTEDAELFERNWAQFSTQLGAIPTIHRAAFAEGRGYLGQPVVISEYGGIALSGFELPEGTKATYYGGLMPNAEGFVKRYKASTEAILQHPFLAGFCYTQLYDIEQEVNGLLSFERRPKVSLAAIARINSAPAASEK